MRQPTAGLGFGGLGETCFVYPARPLGNALKRCVLARPAGEIQNHRQRGDHHKHDANNQRRRHPALSPPNSAHGSPLRNHAKGTIPLSWRN